MKKFIVKHWAASFWVIVFVALTAITLLLLCGAAQACERDGTIHPDSVCIHGVRYGGEYDSAVIHRRWISDSLDWCVGRVDTTWSDSTYYHSASSAWVCNMIDQYIMSIDTTWVLCCDSAARGMRKLSDEAVRQMRIADFAGTDDTIPKPDWIQYPERWYIESVDTTESEFIHVCDVMGCECWKEQLLKICTTWAKKIPLSEVWLRPNEVIKLKWMLEGVK